MFKKIIMLLLMCLSLSAIAESGKPNVVFFFVDDLGYGGFAYTGTTYPGILKTPNIDKIAANGAQFTQAYVTAAICGPSRAGLLSGRYQQSWGAENHYNHNPKLTAEEKGFTPDVKLIAERMKELGYITGRIGKTQLGFAEKFHPLNRGDDFFFGHRGPFGYFLTQKYLDRMKEEGDQSNLWRNWERVETAQDERYITDWHADEAVGFIERNKDKDKPLYLYVAFKGVHGPWSTNPEIDKLFKNATDNRLHDKYLSMIYSVDLAIGKVVETLKQNNMLENTIIMVSTDNGSAEFTDKNSGLEGMQKFNAPFRAGKGKYYDGGTHVPFCMQWPGKIKAGQSYDFLTSMLDVFPTIESAAGGDPSAGLDGINLLPYIDGSGKTPPARNLYWRNFETYAMRNSKWKLIRPRDNKKLELYNLQDDPSESTDVIAQYPEVAQSLLKEWHEWNQGNMKPILSNRYITQEAYERWYKEGLD